MQGDNRVAEGDDAVAFDPLEEPEPALGAPRAQSDHGNTKIVHPDHVLSISSVRSPTSPSDPLDDNLVLPYRAHDP